MVTIEKAEFKNSYHILWLRYVRGINLSQHCMNSLKGTNDGRVRWNVSSLPRIELAKAPFYYLCGVERHFQWAKNLHVAFREKEGAVIDIDDEFCTIRITNAERIDITPEYIDRTLPHVDEKAYNTCRNWWFANYLAAKGYFTDESSKYRQLNLF